MSSSAVHSSVWGLGCWVQSKYTETRDIGQLKKKDDGDSTWSVLSWEKAIKPHLVMILHRNGRTTANPELLWEHDQHNIDQTILLSAAYNDAWPLFKHLLYGIAFVCVYMPMLPQPDTLAQSHLWGASHPRHRALSLSCALLLWGEKGKREIRRANGSERQSKGQIRAR